MSDLYNSGLETKGWYLLRDAVLGALYHNDDSECTWFTELPVHLKEHEVGKLISKVLYENDKLALDKADKKLVGGSKKAWLALTKS